MGHCHWSVRLALIERAQFLTGVTMAPETNSSQQTAPSWREMWHSFGKIGLLSFGGPAAQIALMHSELVDRQIGSECAAAGTWVNIVTAYPFCGG